MRYNHPELRDRLASEYALGTLSARTRRRFERMMAEDGGLRRLVEAWERRLGPLDAALAPLDPPKPLKSAIERRLAESSEPEHFTLRADEGRWIAVAPGIESKVLSFDTATGSGSALYRMAPGSSLPTHEHAFEEECYVIEGEVAVGDMQLGAGDYLRVRKGGGHGFVRSRAGALLFIRGEVA